MQERFDFWYRDKSDHYDYVAIYIDNVFFCKDSMNIITEIQEKKYILKKLVNLSII